MPDLIVTVAPQDPNVVPPPEDVSVSLVEEDLRVVLPVQDMVTVPLTNQLAVSAQPADLVVVATELGPPGPPGPAGPSGTPVVIREAAAALGGHRVVKPVPGNQVNYASSAVPSDGDQILGITQSAANEGDDVAVQVVGEMNEGSWNWTTGGAIYCGVNGVLTQVPPTVGFLCRVAKAISPTSILVNVEEAFILA